MRASITVFSSTVPLYINATGHVLTQRQGGQDLGTIQKINDSQWRAESSDPNVDPSYHETRRGAMSFLWFDSIYKVRQVFAVWYPLAVENFKKADEAPPLSFESGLLLGPEPLGARMDRTEAWKQAGRPETFDFANQLDFEAGVKITDRFDAGTLDTHSGGLGELRHVLHAAAEKDQAREQGRSAVEWDAYIGSAPSFAVAQDRMEEAVAAGVDFAELRAEQEKRGNALKTKFAEAEAICDGEAVDAYNILSDAVNDFLAGSEPKVKADLVLNGRLLNMIPDIVRRAILKPGLIPVPTGLAGVAVELRETPTHILIRVRSTANPREPMPVSIQLSRKTGDWVYMERDGRGKHTFEGVPYPDREPSVGEQERMALNAREGVRTVRGHGINE